jgi:hypothetical protein
MFVIRHKNIKVGTYLNQRATAERRELKPSIWTADITQALSFDFKTEVDQHVQYVVEVVGYPVEAVLTFGVEKEFA